MRTGALVLVPLLVLAPSVAHADPPKAGRVETHADPPTPAERALATTLFRAGRELLAEGKVAEACEKLAESQRMDPGGGTLLNLALCHERLGKTATAWAELNEALALARRDGRTDREDIARERLAALEPVVPRLTVVVADGAEAAVDVRVDDLVLRPVALGTSIPVDPGTHVVSARAEGFVPFEQSVEVAASARVTVTVPRLEPLPAAPVEPTAGELPGASEKPPVASTGEPRSQTLGHGGQLGLLGRADIDAKGRGLVSVVALTYGLGAHVEPSVGAMIGPTSGVWLGGSVYVLEGHWKPVITVGMPLYVRDVVRASVHLGGGLLWDVTRSFGVLVQLAVQLHPAAPVGFERSEILPAIGISVRL
ncbi:MAG: tetratricopeptide repeat protein [Deltaproteobacteria bacterium]|nr:tetratricopeptide repeat protein [Deltaproteobacteria bacterium]